MELSNKINSQRLKLGLNYKDVYKALKPRCKDLKKDHVQLWFENKLLPNNYELKLLSEYLELNYDELESVLLFGHELAPIIQRPVSKLEGKAVAKPPKTKKIEKPNILKPPKEKHCRWCDVETSTECWRHPEDETIKYLAGGGVMGGKNPDQLSVWGCFSCDAKYSTKPDKENYIRQLEHTVAWSKGIIKQWLI